MKKKTIKVKNGMYKGLKITKYFTGTGEKWYICMDENIILYSFKGYKGNFGPGCERVGLVSHHLEI